MDASDTKQPVGSSGKLQLIGLSGKIGSGKNEIARIIRKYCPRFEERAYAWKLKQVVSVATGTPIQDLCTEEGKNKVVPAFGGKTNGELLQLIGTNWRQQFNMDLWVDLLFADFRTIEAFNSDQRKHPVMMTRDFVKTLLPSHWIVYDIRFPNEVKAVKQHGGIVWRINGDPAGCRAQSKRDPKHLSETALDDSTDFDDVIDNSKPGIQEHLEPQVLKLLIKYGLVPNDTKQRPDEIVSTSVDGAGARL